MQILLKKHNYIFPWPERNFADNMREYEESTEQTYAVVKLSAKHTRSQTEELPSPDLALLRKCNAAARFSSRLPLFHGTAGTQHPSLLHSPQR